MTSTPYGRWLPELIDFIAIRSVGADPGEAESMAAAADWLIERLRKLGARPEVVRQGRESVVLASIPAQVDSAAASTIVLYGHFDVQPAGDLALWESPPWQATVRDGWLYGRGAIDTKGHLLMYLEALRAVMSRGELRANVRLVLDGAEESGGQLALEILRNDHEGIDGAVIFDGPMVAMGRPAFYSAARGMLEYHLRVRVAARDLHSGQFGGAGLNAIHALLRILAAVMPDERGRLRDELLQGSTPLPQDIVDRISELPSMDDYLVREGSHPADPHVEADMYTRLWAAPSLEANSIRSGDPSVVHMVLPSTAEAGLSMRLGPGQDPAVIAPALEALLRAATPDGATLELTLRGSAPPAELPEAGGALDIARDAFEQVIGRTPLTVRAGGSLPLLAVFGELGIPTVMTGFDLPEGNIHAPNERLWLEHLPQGTEVLERILSDPRLTSDQGSTASTQRIPAGTSTSERPRPADNADPDQPIHASEE